MILGGHLGLSAPDLPLLAHLGFSVDPLDQIDALADYGFRAVQDLFLKLRPAAEQLSMAQRMAARGMRLSSFGGDPLHWNTPLWSGNDHVALSGSVTESARLARLFGGAGVVVVAGLDPDRPVAAQLADLTENLRRVAEDAARDGLVLLIEPIALQRIPDMLLDRLESAVAVVRAVAMPSVRLMFDIGHVAMMGHDVPVALRQCADCIGLVQAADVKGRERVDIGLGTLDWAAILGALDAVGYPGVIELEHEPVDQSAAGEAAMLDRLAAIIRGQKP
ncbi:hydroxypyruvate isomerase [Sphingobium sp. OAS761]|uniref:sugar phosphate isomerase/epimerase family protein n=1 Tax=Sphingobium sp. OAS761 TaxID=2817901 RepID=UPI00209ED283|nr:sugar phosphate isomerase/epimerase family protein [Sphingobium sp. OAS761]MCP1470335.1 hydroxypyruvate isomerase [Sphingobium sp. OAS761]